MAPVHETCSRNTERSEGDVNRKSKRKRRRRKRRCKDKGWSNTLSTLIRPVKHWDSSAEDADSSSTGSLEVKENPDEKSLTKYKVLRKYPSTFCTTFSRRKQKALKRKQHLVDGKDCHQVCKKSSWSIVQKNPVEHLNELQPGLRYDIVSITGPLHAPVFSVAVDVNGFHFQGQGATKKQAKMRAAEQALQSFIQFSNPTHHVTTGTVSSTNLDFTADKLDLTESAPPLIENCDVLHCNTAKKEMFSSIYNLWSSSLDFCSSPNQRRPVRTSLLEHLSPVALLNELQPGLRYLCQVEKVRGRPRRNFIMVVRLEGRVFEGCGHSKRQAKAQAAADALQSLYNISLRPERTFMGLHGNRTKQQLPQFFAESIYHLVKEKYSQLTESSSTSLTRHKVLAGIVTTRGFDLRSARVVSLATGTKRLDLDNTSDLGCSLTDCHAEVLSRRALVRFLYSQLELLLCNPAEGEEQSIFKSSKSSSDVLRLQDGVLFHMFVSSSPCGDARLNCPYETTTTYPSRRLCCHLRVKVNGGEGTLPVTSQRANQKWDAASPWKPPISMSCTDKMAKWSAVGLQGALLSHLVEPIYLHSLTVGTLSHSGHLSRAMARRLMPVKHLPFPYRRQQLLLGCLSSREIRPAGRAADVSINWSYGDRTLEEVSTSTGRRTVSGTPSRLCRSSMFSCWLRLQEKINRPVLDLAATTETYSAAKMSAGRYQRAVQQFSSSLQVGGLGTWIRKPPKSFLLQCEKN